METNLVLTDGLAEGEAGTVESVSLGVSEDGDKELWFLSLRGKNPAIGLTEQI